MFEKKKLLLLLGSEAEASKGGKEEEAYSIFDQLLVQLLACGITIIYTFTLSLIILLAVKAVCGGLRVSDAEEEKGLDLSIHGEVG